MIFDSQKHWSTYFNTPLWNDIRDFIFSLKPETPEGEYKIADTGVTARIMSYQTRAMKDAVLEAHNRFIDIQVLLDGAETIGCYPRDACLTKEAYDSDRDVEFFVQPEAVPTARLELRPGRFAVLYPQDAHMPQLMADASPREVKKLVIKVPTQGK